MAATYTARKTDTAAYITGSLGNLLTYTDAIKFVAKHRTDATAAKIEITGVIDCSAFRVGVYDAHWEAIDTPVTWARPSVGGETFEILESLR